VHLLLAGTAGGTSLAGSAGGDAAAPTLTMGVVDFVRILAGCRAAGPVPDAPLLATKAHF